VDLAPLSRDACNNELLKRGFLKTPPKEPAIDEGTKDAQHPAHEL